MALRWGSNAPSSTHRRREPIYSLASTVGWRCSRIIPRRPRPPTPATRSKPSCKVHRAMDFTLSEDQQMIRDATRHFALSVIATRTRANEHNERFSIDVMREMAPSGLLGGPVATEYGGAGISSVAYV